MHVAIAPDTGEKEAKSSAIASLLRRRWRDIRQTMRGARWAPLLLLPLALGSPSESSPAPLAYISGSRLDAVCVFDTTADAVTATVPVGAHPRGVAVHPAGTLVYVANEGSSTLSVISTAVNRVVATVPVGRHPDGVAVHPAGTVVYVTDRESNTVSVVDAARNAVTATVPVGSQPVGVAVNRAGTRAYVANSGSGSVSVIDTATNAVTATVSLGPPAFPPRRLRGVAVHPAGTSVYVAAAGNLSTGAVLVIDTATNAVRASVGLPSPAAGVAVHPDGSSVYATSAGAVTFPGPAVVFPSLAVINTVTHAVTALVTLDASTFGSPYGVAVHPAGTLVYVTREDSATMSLVSALTNRLLRTVRLPSASAGYGQFIGPEAVPHDGGRPAAPRDDTGRLARRERGRAPAARAD